MNLKARLRCLHKLVFVNKSVGLDSIRRTALTEIWESSLDILNAGEQIVHWLEVYCQHHGLTPDILPSVVDENPGIGFEEKEATRQQRLLREKAQQLAESLWKKDGTPAGGPIQFLAQAETILRQALA